MRKNCSTAIRKRQKNRKLLGKAGVTPKALRFIDNKIISSSPKVVSIRPTDSKNDLSSPAIGKISDQCNLHVHIRNFLRTSISRFRNKYGTAFSLWNPIGLFVVAQKERNQQINIVFTSI
ncbi:MAG: hypothetical protein H6Q58_2281 [Firmicutes bacterium]|nr:hypothetical protein [Bacillota bacterium]